MLQIVKHWELTQSRSLFSIQLILFSHVLPSFCAERYMFRRISVDIWIFHLVDMPAWDNSGYCRILSKSLKVQINEAPDPCRTPGDWPLLCRRQGFTRMQKSDKLLLTRGPVSKCFKQLTYVNSKIRKSFQ